MNAVSTKTLENQSLAKISLALDMAELMPGKSTNDIMFTENQIRIARTAYNSSLELRNMLFVWIL